MSSQRQPLLHSRDEEEDGGGTHSTRHVVTRPHLDTNIYGVVDEDLVAPESPQCKCLTDTFLYFVLALSVLIVAWWSQKMDAQEIGVINFSISILLGLFSLAVTQYFLNTREYANPIFRPVFGLPVGFIFGTIAKIGVLIVDVVLFWGCQLLGFDMGNPHKSRPLNYPELSLRIVVAAVVLIGFTEEFVKFQVLLTFDQENNQYNTFYHPLGIILVSTAISLGATAWNIIPHMYQSDHLLPWYYSYTEASMEAMLNAATGIMVGVALARRMFYTRFRKDSTYEIIWRPACVRAVFYLIYMLPLRCRSWTEEEIQQKHIFHHITRYLYIRKHTLPAVDVGAYLAVVYLSQFAFVCLVCVYAMRMFQDLMVAKEDPLEQHGIAGFDEDDGEDIEDVL